MSTKHKSTQKAYWARMTKHERQDEMACRLRVSRGHGTPRESKSERNSQLFRRDIRNAGFDVVTVSDLPLTRRESSYDEVIREVNDLPTGVGIRLRFRACKPDAEGKATAIRAWGARIGKPVTTQVRSAGGKSGDGEGYQIWVFKKRDWITKRNGHSVRT